MSTDWMKDAQEACDGICPNPADHKLHTDGKHAYEACPHCGGSEPLAAPKVDDHVKLRVLRDPLSDDETRVIVTGTVTRVWDKPEHDPYVTVQTDGDRRTFVRCTSRVAVIPAGAPS